MKTFLKIFAVLIIVAIGVIYYLYNQVSYMPVWYENTNQRSVKNLIRSSVKIDTQIKKKLNSGKTVEINPEQLSSLVVSNAKKYIAFNPEEVIKGINTEISPDKVTIEAMLNIKNIPKNQIPKQARIIFDKFLESMPVEVFENFYVKIEGKPISRNGQMILDENINIQLGKVKYSLDELSEQFMGEKIGKKFILLKSLPFTNIFLEDGFIKIIPK